MNIVILSDLNWLPHDVTISEKELIDFELEDLQKLRYERVERYLSIVLSEKADLVLFAGDVTGDGSCGHGFHHAFLILLKMLDAYQIPSVYISGNHDEVVYYQELFNFRHLTTMSTDICGKVIDILGLKILGISYENSSTKTELKSIISDHKEMKFDIVVAHSQLNRRIRLFDITTDYIFTGHYDRKILSYKDKVFVSLDNDSDEVSYAVINKMAGAEDLIHLKIKPNVETLLALSDRRDRLIEGNRNNIVSLNGKPSMDLTQLELISDNKLINEERDFTYWKYVRGTAYCKCLDAMDKVKHKLYDVEKDIPINQIMGTQITANYVVTESLIEDYLGNVL